MTGIAISARPYYEDMLQQAEHANRELVEHLTKSRAEIKSTRDELQQAQKVGPSAWSAV